MKKPIRDKRIIPVGEKKVDPFSPVTPESI
jgi:hypothetical protein